MGRLVVLGVAISSAVALTAVAAPAQAAPRAATHQQSLAKHKHYVPPIKPADVVPALNKYRHYVHARIAELVPAVRRLHDLLVAGDEAAAKKAWLKAHLIWLRIGQDDGAYGAFGNLGRRIDGTAAGYPRGVNDPAFAGFHRVEHELWVRHRHAVAVRYAAKLVDAVDHLAHVSLQQALPGDATGTANFILRSHEITEDAVRDTLSGDDEYGSGTALASITADIAGTREVLRLLAPLIKPRSPGRVAKARHLLSEFDAAAKTGYMHGHWTKIAALPRRQREQIDATGGAADEELAPIPDILRFGSH